MPISVGAPSSSRNYIANCSAHVQSRGISIAHRLPGQHSHPSVHGMNDPEGLGQYAALLMSEDASAHTNERAAAGRGRRVQGHTRFCKPLAGWRQFIATSALHM